MPGIENTNLFKQLDKYTDAICMAYDVLKFPIYETARDLLSARMGQKWFDIYKLTQRWSPAARKTSQNLVVVSNPFKWLLDSVYHDDEIFFDVMEDQKKRRARAIQITHKGDDTLFMSSKKSIDAILYEIAVSSCKNCGGPSQNADSNVCSAVCGECCK